MTAPEKEITEYFDRHRIPVLFYELGASLAYHMPENPVDFLITEISKRLTGPKSAALFRSICVGVETSITRDSAVLALKSLIPSHSGSNLKLQELTIPAKVTEDVFIQLASTFL